MIRYAVALGALASTACSLLFNLEAFQGSGADRTIDADGGAGLAQRDADAPDAAIADASAPDATRDAASESPCKSAHLFCEDFETGIAPAWSVKEAPGTSISVVSSRARSGRSSLQLRKVANATVGTAHIERVAATANLRCEADVYYEALPNLQSALYVVSATSPAPFNFFQYSLERDLSGEATIDSYRLPDAFVDGPNLGELATIGTWLHTSFLVEGKRFTASFAGTQNSFSPAAPTAASGWKLEIGMPYENTAGNWNLFLDDIFCDALP
jgi:hypothetical protein